MAPGGTPVPPEARGREPPSFFFFLDLLPRWEKGFPSGPWPPWQRRGESPSEIGSLSLYFLLFPRSLILPFHRFLNSRRSVSPIRLKFGHNFYPDIGFVATKEGNQPPYGVATRAQGVPAPGGRAPLPRGPLGHRLMLVSLPKIHIYSKKIFVCFIPFGLRLIWIFCETKNMQQTGTGTGHWINMLVPKIV